MKTKKTTWVFFFHKHSKFWSISLGQKVEHKPVFSEEWACSISRYTAMWIYICAICTSVALLCLASSGQILLSKQFPHEKCIIRRKIKLLPVNQETSEKSAEISILWLPEKTTTMWFWLFWKFLLEVSTLVATILRFQLIFQMSPDSLTCNIYVRYISVGNLPI